MNKKLIRLTESDIHRIVKESVKKILAEADPRSWDVVARRYDQTDPQKAAYARQRAVQQWNNQYGDSATKMNDDYSVDTDYGDVYMTYPGYGDNKMMSIGHEHAVPNAKGTWDLTHTDYTSNANLPKDSNARKIVDKSTGRHEWQGEKYPANFTSNIQPAKVASQMKTGKGIYNKNKGGWQ